ncbi:MAG: hypothetical protein JXB10_02075, partial [Pirellulales bacterium]|nr:hypothetical protein [Pirellulales bacterium]
MPRIVLLMSPHAGYDRGVIRGIARYAREHGPWAFLLSGEQLQIVDYAGGKTVGSMAVARLSGDVPRRTSVLDLERLNASGIIGRLYSRSITEAALASGLPIVAMDLAEEQAADANLVGRVSEIRPDSHKAGRMAAEHLLDRGFRQFAFCGFQGEIWSKLRREGFLDRLQEAGRRCGVFPSPEQKSRLPWQREQPHVTA